MAEILLAASFGYGVAGIAVALAFLLVGLERVDPAARGAYAFRPLLLPGLVLLWPLVLWRWRVPAGPRTVQGRLRATHLWAWLVLAAVLPAILLGGLALRLTRPPAEAPVRLSPP